MQMTDPLADRAGTNRGFSAEAYRVFNHLRRTGQLCDAVIRAEERRFPVHSAIMAACSPAFRQLFTNVTHATEQREVFIPGMTQWIMDKIIEYAYTGTTVISADNVERLLCAADQFHVIGLLKTCCNFLVNKLEDKNVIGIRSLAQNYFCTGLARTAQKFLLKNFAKVAENSNELLMLTLAEMLELLASDELNVPTEEIVFGAALRWIQHDPATRQQHVPDLLQCVRLGRLTTQFFVENVKAHPYIRDNEICRPMMIDTIKFLYKLDVEGVMEVDLSHPLSRPRIPHDILFVVGGWSGGGPTNVIEAYDARADRWTLTDCPAGFQGPSAYHGLATLGHTVYLVGGFDGTDFFNGVQRFDPSAKTWTEVGPMNQKRCYVSVTVLDDCIYAMGGYDGRTRHKTVERYTAANNQWSLVTPMNATRSDASAATLAGRVYIAGGFNGMECLSSAEYYDPTADKWTLASPMRNRRSGVGVISHDGFLFAVGGFNGEARLKSAEKYNPSTNTWAPIADMNSARSNFAIEVIDGVIFVIGGFNGVTTVYDVECYTPATDEWFDCADVHTPRSALSACVVKGLPNARDFAHQPRGRAEGRAEDGDAAEGRAEDDDMPEGMAEVSYL